MIVCGITVDKKLSFRQEIDIIPIFNFFDRQTDRPTDRQNDRQTDTVRYRSDYTSLKNLRNSKIEPYFSIGCVYMHSSQPCIEKN